MKITAKKTVLFVVLMVVVVTALVACAMLVKNKGNMTVTSLDDLYDDETRAQEDIAAMKEAGILDANGKMVDLDIRENGASVSLAALTTRIAAGESIGEITVNGNVATAEQVMKISQVSAAVEIAELLDTEIEVTDEHVSNLEALLSGIQNGSIDLENTLKTGVLCLSPSSNTLSPQTTGNVTPVRGTTSLPTLDGAGTAAGMLNVSQDGTSYIGSYINGSEYDAEHAFEFPEDVENRDYYYVDSNTGNITGVANPDAVTVTIEDTVTNAINQESHVGYLLWEINPNFTFRSCR